MSALRARGNRSDDTALQDIPPERRSGAIRLHAASGTRTPDLRVASGDGNLFVNAEVRSDALPLSSIGFLERMMRALVGLYLVIGIVLLAIAYLLPGPCENRNTDIVSNVVFVLTWPVGLYAEVYQGHLSVQEWLHAHACQGGDGLGTKKIKT